MRLFVTRSCALSCAAAEPRLSASVCAIALALALVPAASGQQTSPTQPSPQPVSAQQPVQPASVDSSQAGAITEDEIMQLLVGKSLYLRGGYLDNSLNFDEYGHLIGHSPQESYTLNLVQIDKVRLVKRKLELQGVRYGLHFLGATDNEDPTKAVDKVRITPKKKLVKITIDRELVVIPKKKKARKGSAAEDAAESAPSKDATTEKNANAGTEMAFEPEADRPVPARTVTTTKYPAHAAQLLRDAVDRFFAPGLDSRMIAALPAFWKLYYQAVDAHADYRPSEPGVFRQNDVDQKAELVTRIEPPSNEYAQTGGVAGMALYHAVIGADGKPQQIVVGRPIGFGLDESAAETISNASFQPALKDGKPVPVLLDLLVQFRIYSKRTAVESSQETANKPAEAVLPGPYSAARP